jgi:hypothetical protein
MLQIGSIEPRKWPDRLFGAPTRPRSGDAGRNRRHGPAGTYLAALAPDLRAPIEQAVAAAYRSGAPDGPRSLTATAWAVRGNVG